MSLDLTAFAAALKTRYPDWVVENLIYKNNPFFALLPKDENFYGDGVKIPLLYGNPQNRSATFATAKAGTTTSKVAAFTLTRKKDYSMASVDNETVMATKNDNGAFMQAWSTEVDGALHSLGRSVASSLFRAGTGAIGAVANTSYATTTLTLTDPETVANFEVGMVIVTSTANGGGSVKSGTLTITGVDRGAGTITTGANLSTGIATIATNDYIFCAGDYDAKISGFDAWVPYDDRSTRLAASFYGVTRSSDASRLGGLYYDGTGMPIEEALISALALAGREGASTDYAFFNNTDFGNLKKSLGSKVIYTDIKAGSNAQIGFRGIVVSGDKGDVTCLADPNQMPGRVAMVQLETWKLMSLGKPVSLFEGDGLKMLRNSTTDSMDLQCFSYANLACRAPGWNLHLKLR